MSETRNDDIVLRTSHVVKQFPVSSGRTLTACSDISLDVRKGRTLGIVGESGCGKSTFVRMLTLMDEPTSGDITFRGKSVAHLTPHEKRLHRQNVQMVFQDPWGSFDPKMRMIDSLTEPLMNFGRISRSEKAEKAAELLRMVELPEDFLYRYPAMMSGGQRQRANIARAIALEPELLICDEATSALDASVQRNIIELLVRLQREKGISMVFICHDLALIQSFAHQVAVMYLGHIVELLPGEAVRSGGAKHPYTQALLKSVFTVDMDRSRGIEPIGGDVPSPLNIPAGCPFQNRCDRRTDRCADGKPPLVPITDGHSVACRLYQ